MESLENKTVAEIVSDNFRTAEVFKKYGIDFCCGGQVNVSEISHKRGVDISSLKSDLIEILEDEVNIHDYNHWTLDFLVDYVINVHHSYVHESIPLIKEYLQKVAKVHGHGHKEVLEIQTFFQMVAEELLLHMQKEEKILFPFIKKITEAKKKGKTIEGSILSSIEGPIEMMELEHENAGNIFRTISSLSDKYTPPSDACSTYNVLYAKLQEFEADLHKHIHLENNIIFPKAQRLCKALLTKPTRTVAG
ncbi:MAG: iron-sulfur cluster repair di-iron protein [Cyclobacteriaceae bacterium]